MNKQRQAIFFDGQKAVDLWGDDLDGWTVMSGQKADNTQADYYKFIPTLYRAAQLRSYSVATMPFEIRKGKKVYDSSSEWENKVGFLPNPTVLLQLIEAALTMTGTAYLYRERNIAMTKSLKYHLPSSVTPEINPDTGDVLAFKRATASGVPKSIPPRDYVYFWLPDPYVEVGPPINFPAQAAANACGVLLNVDLFADAFFKRGAIKAMLLTVKGMPQAAEREKLEAWWKRVVGGIKNAFGAKVINADAVTPVLIGEGMKELENTTLSQEKREDIAVAVGIPMSILFANAANYATSQQDELNFLNKTIIPECEFVQAVLNEQIFEALGLQFVFMPETLDAMQEDETARAASLKQLIDSGLPLLMAMDLLGYELTDEQRAELEAAEAEKKAAKEQMDQARMDALNNPQPEPEPGQAEEKPNPLQEEAAKWQRKALNALRRGKSPAVEFSSTIIPMNVYRSIVEKLNSAQDEASVKAAFVIDFTPPIVPTVETITPDFINGLLAVIREAAQEGKQINERLLPAK